MNAPENPSGLRQMAKMFGDVGAYVAAVLSYITLITGNLPGRFPKTAAVLGVVVTCILLCAWRWTQITRQRTGKPQEAEPGSPGVRESSFLKLLRAPFRSSGEDTYYMPLLRRQVEGAALLGLVVFTAGWSVTALPRVAYEFNPPRFTLESPCNAEEEAPRVVIADFFETTANEILFEQRLYDEMTRQAVGDVQICRMKQVMEDRAQALEAQEALGSTVFIWGRSDRDAVDVHLEVSGWDILAEDIWSFRNDEQGFQAREAAHLTFMTRYSFSWIRYVNGAYTRAREELETAAEAAKNQPWVQESDNTTDLADAYFLLGLIYEDDDSLPEADRLHLAKADYDRAIALQPDSDRSILNRGRVCMVLEDVECAIQDFTDLIDRNSSFALDAYINRAGLQPSQELAEQDLTAAVELNPAQGYPARGDARLSWGDLEGAVSDLEAARHLTPEDPFVYHSLGAAQLFSGHYQAAIQTYKDSLSYLDSETRDLFLEDMDYLEPPSGADPSFEEAVAKIKTILQEASLLQ